MLCMLINSDPPMLAALGVLGNVWPYLLMLAGFSLIIFVHELGHFAVAKWAGVKVERFAIGFGRELFGFTWGETRYSFNILPLGGYVKMLGQEDFENKENELQFKDDPRSFVNKPVGHRMAVVSAGVIMNTLFACLLFMIVFLVGRESLGTRIADVVPDSPAERAGLAPGDEIRQINGKRVLEFSEVQMSIMLAPLHEPINLLVDRSGRSMAFSIQPEYLIPENTRDARRLVVGIVPGVTREITAVGPDIDASKPESPHVGDKLVEIAGVEVTDENASAMVPTLAYTKGDVFVERRDPNDPEAPAKRVRVDVPPILSLYPSGDSSGLIHVLGLAPLVRFDRVDPRGRAYLADLEVSDTILSFNDVPYPTRASIARSIRDNPERDVYFKVRKQDGRIVTGFVRPKRNRKGPATIQALCTPIGAAAPDDNGPRALFSQVRPHGRAAQAGVEPGDVVLACNGQPNPTMAQVNRSIRESAGRPVRLTVAKPNGRTLATDVVPVAPGAIDASMNLVADDLLRVAEVVKTVYGEPTSAAEAGLSRGILITAVNSTPVHRWYELIEQFRLNAGSNVQLAYRDTQDAERVADFFVPSSLRTLIGVGPEARILSIDGKKTVKIDMGRGSEEVAVGYRRGIRAQLLQLVGRTDVPVEYRRDPRAPIETGLVNVTKEMVNPWLSQVAYQTSISPAPQFTILRGENALDAVGIGLHKTYYFILQVYNMLKRMIFTRTVGLDNISGPLGIIDVGGRMARAGLVDFVFFMAIISANLAVLNFLPLPILDGGLMVFLIIEGIKGSPVSIRVQIATQMIGLFLIVGMFLFVTFNDAIRLWG